MARVWSSALVFGGLPKACVLASVLALTACIGDGDSGTRSNGDGNTGGSGETPPVETVEPSISVAGASITEGDSGQTNLVFTLTLSEAATGAVSVGYSTAAGTAQDGIDYVAVSGSVSFAAGETYASISVPVVGDTEVEPDETFTLQLSNPSGATLAAASAVGTIVNDDQVASVKSQISIADASIVEGNEAGNELSLSIAVSPASSEDIGLQLATADGTALAGEDYTATNTSVTVPAGSTAVDVLIPILSDDIAEDDETFTVTLSNLTSGVISESTATITIVDDDDAPVVSVLSLSPASVVEGNDGTTALSFSVSVTPAAASDIEVDIATADGTALAGEDYLARSETITIAAGSAQATVDISVLGDTQSEDDEQLSLTIANAVGADIDVATAVGTIVNDDTVAPALSSVSVAAASLVEGDSGDSEMQFALTITPAASQDITLQASTTDGTAVAGEDYAGLSETITIPAGSETFNVGVLITGDAGYEEDEQFSLVLSDAVGAELGQATALGTIENDDPLVGMNERPSNTSCIAPDEPTSSATVSTEDLFSGVYVNQPTKVAIEPGTGRYFVALRLGFIAVYDSDTDNTQTVWLDISSQVNTGGEGGLLGFAFHPDYPSTPVIYLSYTTGTDMTSVVTKLTVDNTTLPTVTTEETVLTVDQPFQNHNGGDIGFGPDGYLYVGLGDGGGGNDTLNRAQSTNYLLGSILRVDVLDPAVSYPATPYVIPADNPFAANPICGAGENSDACPEIYAWGFRNPWRWNFDSATGELWAGDVGQEAQEEINIVQRGGNYGWRCYEGTDPTPGVDFSSCTGTYQRPDIAYTRSSGNAVTGGVVYRGSAIPALVGQYVFGDYGNGTLWATTAHSQDLSADLDAQMNDYQLLTSNFGYTSFAADANGEIIFTDIKNGRVRRVIPAAISSNDTVPTTLSQTGCVLSTDPTQAADGMIPYTINAPFWSDVAEKTRYLAIPDGATIDIDGDGDFSFPVGSVLMKNFRLNNQLVETRLMMRHSNGNWAGYSYEWNSAQTEATRVDGGKTAEVQGQTYTWPSGAQCTACHTAVAGVALGPEIAEFNGEFAYPASGVTANQLATLEHIGLFSAGLPDTVDNLDALANPGDIAADLADRARAWLHSNCSQCHRDGGPTPVDLDFRYQTALADTAACDIAPSAGDLGISNARIIAPGDSSRSVLIERIARRDALAMPPIGSHYIDTDNVAMLSQWIDNLSSCTQ
ncbi:Calx-beta domain-containing protein [Halioxenophilus aromaticivorans]|uniref:Cytochrome c domain-containing protein n=1 Tax=Halioxenophilus aromaticivorans TaxID=1306992 RepID=A0AAV3U4E1_9ALTE